MQTIEELRAERDELKNELELTQPVFIENENMLTQLKKASIREAEQRRKIEQLEGALREVFNLVVRVYPALLPDKILADDDDDPSAEGYGADEPR